MEEPVKVEFTWRLFAMKLLNVTVDPMVRVDADKLLRARLLLQFWAPWVETVKTYPCVTNEPSGL